MHYFRVIFEVKTKNPIYSNKDLCDELNSSLSGIKIEDDEYVSPRMNRGTLHISYCRMITLILYFTSDKIEEVPKIYDYLSKITNTSMYITYQNNDKFNRTVKVYNYEGMISHLNSLERHTVNSY
ncbi:MAG: hypothetical protein IJ086_10730 [Clostridium sp.]|nr:hypothetical protein [Clostridium sp.]